MKGLHGFIVALVVACIVLLPLWFSVRGSGAQSLVAAPVGGLAGDGRPGGNLRSNGGRVFVGGGRRSGK